MLQQDEPDDYVLASGKSHTVREFLEIAFAYVRLDPYSHLRINKSLFRPAEFNTLRGDPRKARIKLAWESKIELEELIAEMVENDLRLNSQRGFSEMKTDQQMFAYGA